MVQFIQIQFISLLCIDMEALDYDPLLRGPFTLVIAGPSRSGKTELTKKILERRDEIIHPPLERIVYCYGTELPSVFQYLKQRIPGIEFHKGIPDEFGDETRRRTLVVIDDLMEECANSKNVLQAFVRESHHRNVDILLLCQVSGPPGTHSVVMRSIVIRRA